MTIPIQACGHNIEERFNVVDNGLEVVDIGA